MRNRIFLSIILFFNLFVGLSTNFLCAMKKTICTSKKKEEHEESLNIVMFRGKEFDVSEDVIKNIKKAVWTNNEFTCDGFDDRFDDFEKLLVKTNKDGSSFLDITKVVEQEVPKATLYDIEIFFEFIKKVNEYSKLRKFRPHRLKLDLIEDELIMQLKLVHCLGNSIIHSCCIKNLLNKISNECTQKDIILAKKLMKELPKKELDIGRNGSLYNTLDSSDSYLLAVKRQALEEENGCDSLDDLKIDVFTKLRRGEGKRENCSLIFNNKSFSISRGALKEIRVFWEYLNFDKDLELERQKKGLLKRSIVDERFFPKHDITSFIKEMRPETTEKEVEMFIHLTNQIYEYNTNETVIDRSKAFDLVDLVRNVNNRPKGLDLVDLVHNKMTVDELIVQLNLASMFDNGVITYMCADSLTIKLRNFLATSKDLKNAEDLTQKIIEKMTQTGVLTSFLRDSFKWRKKNISSLSFEQIMFCLLLVRRYNIKHKHWCLEEPVLLINEEAQKTFHSLPRWLRRSIVIKGWAELPSWRVSIRKFSERCFNYCEKWDTTIIESSVLTIGTLAAMYAVVKLIDRK